MKLLPSLLIAVILALSLVSLAACGDDEPEGEVNFIEPLDGAQVTSPFTVRMGAEGIVVEPAGEVRDGFGHHHIIIDAELPALDQPIPSDGQHRHFGGGQTETALDLAPGEHTLRLLFAKGNHVPYDPAITDTIRITITERREVSFIEPLDGAQVTSPFTVRMGAEGIVVEPAGEVRDGFGHHHIIIDAELPALDQPIPSDGQHRHFGGGQTETALDLAPGEHTLRLLFAKGNHVPYDPAITDTIRITITERREVSFIEPLDGAQVTSPFTVRMGAEGIVVEPAGEVREGFGHHHIIIDAELPALDQPIPSDEQHRHFGGGQTETALDLAPGEHTLGLLFASGNHVPYDPAITETITVVVADK